MKQIEVQIMGQGYLLGCPEGGEDRLHMAVQKVDEAMCKIRDAGKTKARDRIAVLAALNLAFDLTDKPIFSGSKEVQTDQFDSLLQRLDDTLREDGQLL